jgi:hypothetical protein
MTANGKLSERVVAELIAQLGRIAYGEGLVTDHARRHRW